MPPVENPVQQEPHQQPQQEPQQESQRLHWHHNLRLTSILLLIWFIVTFGVAYFARDLSFNFFGWPFSYWVAAQGALVVYLAIVAFYARSMDRLDAEHGVAEDD